MTTDNMRLIMAKVRAHIMTGQSASTPAFTFTKASPTETKQDEVSLPPPQQANSIPDNQHSA